MGRDLRQIGGNRNRYPDRCYLYDKEYRKENSEVDKSVEPLCRFYKRDVVSFQWRKIQLGNGSFSNDNHFVGTIETLDHVEQARVGMYVRDNNGMLFVIDSPLISDDADKSKAIGTRPTVKTTMTLRGIDEYVEKNIKEVEKPLETLPAPTIEIVGNMLRIGTVPSAEYYDIYIDTILQAITNGSTYDLSFIALEEGIHSVYVIARAENFLDSEPSNPAEYEAVDEGKNYFCISNISKKQNFVTLTNNNKLIVPEFEYAYSKKAEGKEWHKLEYDKPIEIPIGKRIYIRGNNILGFGSLTHLQYISFSSTEDAEVLGNIMSLVDKDVERTVMADYQFDKLFSGWQTLIYANRLILPAQTATHACYQSMFRGCKRLKTIPELPATALHERCYAYMFAFCVSITELPELPALELAERCYDSMFYYCTSIRVSSSEEDEYKTPYRIPSGEGQGTTAEDATNDMFRETGGTYTGSPTINRTYYLYSGEPIGVKLETPTVKAIGSVLITVPVKNAVTAKIYVDDEYKFTMLSITVLFDMTLLNLSVGVKHKIQVKMSALGYLDSELSEPVYFTPRRKLRD